jgi:hypothetical protein
MTGLLALGDFEWLAGQREWCLSVWKYAVRKASWKSGGLLSLPYTKYKHVYATDPGVTTDPGTPIEVIHTPRKTPVGNPVGGLPPQGHGEVEDRPIEDHRSE